MKTTAEVRIQESEDKMKNSTQGAKEYPPLFFPFSLLHFNF